MHQSKMIFRQLFEGSSSTYSYILADSKTLEGIIIDPVLETLDRDLKLLKELKIKLLYILDTHVHADHITSSSKLKERTGAKIVLGKATSVDCADLLLEDGEELNFGSLKIVAISTPGHTDGCTSYLCEDLLFSGDTLLIRGNGRTDFQEGSPETLFNSVREKLFTLPDETFVYPGHNYSGLLVSTIAEEKEHNPRLGLKNSFEQFKDIMDNLNLANPKKIDVAVPANLKCGRVD